MQSVESKQMRYLKNTRDQLLEKRRRRQERERGDVVGDLRSQGGLVGRGDVAAGDLVEGGKERLAGQV